MNELRERFLREYNYESEPIWTRLIWERYAKWLEEQLLNIRPKSIPLGIVPIVMMRYHNRPKDETELFFPEWWEKNKQNYIK